MDDAEVEYVVSFRGIRQCHFSGALDDSVINRTAHYFGLMVDEKTFTDFEIVVLILEISK